MADKYKGVSPSKALNWAVSLALSDAVSRGLIDYDTMIKLSSTMDDFYMALMRGEMLDPQADGTVKIRKRPATTAEDEAEMMKAVREDDDTLVLGGKKEGK